ncbi:MAG: GAF domain-containing sensor histidine kinase, partial [Actinomycetes bacterium]
GSLAGHVLLTGQTLRVLDASTDPRAAGPAPGQLAYGPSLVVPLRAAEDVLGVLMVSNTVGSPGFTDEAEDVLTGFAGQAAIALELGRQRREAEQARLFSDRDRIARDLHDLVIQRLFATGMRLDSVAGRVEDAQARERVLGAVEDLDETIREIRTTIYSLQATNRAEADSLRARVLATVEAASGEDGPTSSVRFDGLVDSVVGAEVSEQLLAVLREAVSNARRHAQAKRLDVVVSAADGKVTLQVTDDGVGIPADVPRSGLANLAERALLLGGSFSVTTPDGGGTHLSWTVPAD